MKNNGKKQYFIVRNDELQFFRSFEQEKCLGAINLNGCQLKRHATNEFGKEGCWTVRETVSIPKKKYSYTKYNRNEFKQGSFVLSSTTTRREDWLCVLDHAIYTLAIVESKKNHKNNLQKREIPNIEKKIFNIRI